MYCARLANCHMLRSVCSVLGASTGSSASISSRARFRAGIVGSVPGATRRRAVHGWTGRCGEVLRRSRRGVHEGLWRGRGAGEDGRGEGECGSHDDEEVAFQIADFRESRKGQGAGAQQLYDILHVLPSAFAAMSSYMLCTVVYARPDSPDSRFVHQ